MYDTRANRAGDWPDGSLQRHRVYNNGKPTRQNDANDSGGGFCGRAKKPNLPKVQARISGLAKGGKWSGTERNYTAAGLPEPMLIPNLVYLRHAARMSQTEMAKELGITRQTLSSYEDGRANMSLLTFFQVANLFQVEPYSLMFLNISKP